ncbi:esterase [Mycobacterium triplex]|uniref:Esterase n=1 Tax=Mycobacterium triplex TaxID=47839 RepID=A0A024JRN7_9MYCO|nr:alpha/beta hydrolase [Mycobacterium triplex]ORW99134.1 esterase [Mycobacterium triplex]CDO86204.1 lipase [Mycobacterium triplex]
MTTYAFDPEIAAVLPHLPDLPGDDPLAIRAAMSDFIAALPVPDTTGVQIEDREIPGRDGDPAVPIRIYRPDQPSAAAGVYSVHGGGFIAGDLETEHGSNVMLARELGVVVVSVDYRLAPETPFPGGLEDVYAGLVWMAAQADELGIDPQRIAIHGMSAGGGLCAALALLARDRGGPHIAFQFLSVPELDDRLTTASMTDFTDTPLWSRPRAVVSWDSYLGAGRAGTDDVPIYAAPARATDLAGLPPAYVSVMHFDPLRDEGVAYALAMLAAGVTVELHLFPGTFHGSMLIQDAVISRREEAEKIAVLRRALAL